MPKPTQRLSPLTNPTGETTTPHAPAGATGPGFYQGMIGRKTGRPAPIPGGHGRTLPRHEAVLAAHGLMDQGAANPNQGQLLSPSELPPKMSPREMAVHTGTPPPLASSRPGFMPELYETKNAAGEIGTRTTAQAHKTMVGAIQRLGEHELTPSGQPPVREGMRSRQATRELHQGDAPWYASRSETTPEAQMRGASQFEVGPGSATHMITEAAARTGTSYEKMARATAITSPRTAWTEGTPGTSDFIAPNMESAENVVRNVQSAQSSTRITDRSSDFHEIGHASGGRSLGEMKAKAAVDFVGSSPALPIPIGDLSSQKVPNFNQSLLQAHPSQSVRKQAALSYTVDTHDVSSQGSSVDLLKTPGGYAVSRMLGRRTALKNNELGPMGQSGVWMGQKSKEPEPMGRNALFQQTRGGKLRPNPAALPGAVETDDRSPTAKRLGIEF